MKLYNREHRDKWTMRDFKFRAWDNQKKVMVEVWGLGVGDLKSITTPDAYETKIEDRYSIMQYIGIKDRNGKEIYEGDIVQLPISRMTGLFVICYFEELAAFRAINKKGSTLDLSDKVKNT
jgi:uncharacterized phage protein (TIGR01671 family)